MAFGNGHDDPPPWPQDYADLDRESYYRSQIYVEPGATVPDQNKTAEREKKQLPVVWLDDATIPKDADYLVKGIVERENMLLIYGPSNSGKSFFAIDLAGHICAGLPWRNKRVKQGLVIYIAAEAGNSIIKRFVVWRDAKLTENRGASITPMAIITRAVNLLHSTEVADLIAQLKDISVKATIPVSMVVIDTLSRSIPGGDENTAGDMTMVIAASDAIRDNLGAAVAIIHHTGKDLGKGARGHSSLFAACDTAISVVEKVATVEKSRDGETGEKFSFSLTVVEIGKDSDNENRTTCLVQHEETHSNSMRKTPPKLGATAQCCLDALCAAIDLNGQQLPETSEHGRVKAVSVEKWRDQYHRIRPIDQSLSADDQDRESNSRRMAFNRARDEIQAKNVAGTDGKYWWIF